MRSFALPKQHSEAVKGAAPSFEFEKVNFVQAQWHSCGTVFSYPHRVVDCSASYLIVKCLMLIGGERPIT